MCINIHLCLSITCRPGDANPCAKDGFLVLPSPQAATFNSSFSASDYLPDTYCLVGTVDDGLWKSHLGQSSCLHVPASSVGDERSSTAHLRPASLRPHLRRTHQPPLAPGSGESTVQDGRAYVQGHSWNCAVIPESTGSCRRSAWPTFPPLCSDQSSAGTISETLYRRRQGLSSRRTHHLEQPARQCDICPVSVNCPSAFKSDSVPGLVP